MEKDTTLSQILHILKSIKDDYKSLASTVESINGRVNDLSEIKHIGDTVKETPPAANPKHDEDSHLPPHSQPQVLESATLEISPASSLSRSTPISRIILTTYPGQAGIDPLPMNWGHRDPLKRGPVVVHRSQSTIRRRNGGLQSSSWWQAQADGCFPQQLVPMEVPIQHIMLWLLLAKIWTPNIGQISRVPSLPSTLGLILSGLIQGRLSPWILWVT